jgi:outer membrane protein assembly factor BamE (lipoprotein component of BamABCDE complex)
MKKILIIFILLLSSCSLNKVIKHHGVHNLEKKQSKLKINETNKNDIIKLIGPPSTQGAFDNDILIYIERKTSSSKVTKLGRKNLLKNDVLVLELNNKGMLISKNFYNKEDMNVVNFDKENIEGNFTKRSFVYNFLRSVREKIDDPLNKKRIKN